MPVCDSYPANDNCLGPLLNLTGGTAQDFQKRLKNARMECSFFYSKSCIHVESTAILLEMPEGRAGDLVLFSGNPTDSIKAIRDIKTVWRNGETAVKKMSNNFRQSVLNA